MSTRCGVSAAILSSTLGGMSAAVTRYAIGSGDSVLLAWFRFGIGFLVLLPLALLLPRRWPPRRDWAGVAGLGVMFFALFFIVYNTALRFTTAGRGALALSVLPMMTMAVGALLGIERLTLRKTSGVLLAMSGVGFALGAGLGSAPPGAWRGDLLMAGATFCMALYNVWSRPFISRSSPLHFATVGMGVGAAGLFAAAAGAGSFAALAHFGRAQWLAMAYLGVGGGAAAFYLWSLALEHATPTQVANTMTVNPLAASLLAAILIGEPIGAPLIVGIGAVGAGIWIASTHPRNTPDPPQSRQAVQVID